MFHLVLLLAVVLLFWLFFCLWYLVFFVCGSCKADYIGRKKRHLSTRIKEHLETDKKTHVYKHLNESQRCKAFKQ